MKGKITKDILLYNTEGRVRYTTTNINFLKQRYSTNGCGSKKTAWIPEIKFHEDCKIHDYMWSGVRDGFLDTTYYQTNKVFRINMHDSIDMWHKKKSKKAYGWGKVKLKFKKSFYKRLADMYYIGVQIATKFK